MEAVLYYKIFFVYLKVEVIMWWNFVDVEWFNVFFGFIIKDGRVKFIYYEFYRFIKGEWWIDQVYLIIDEYGMVNILGYLGDYEIIC